MWAASRIASQVHATCTWGRIRRAASTSVKGWIYAVRQHRDVNFLDVADGSQTKHVQVVASDDIIKQVGRLRFGDCVVCEGQFVASAGPRQKTEFRAERITRIADNDMEPSSSTLSLEEIRQATSTRAKHPLFAALMRFRSRLSHEIRSHFQRSGYVEVNCPILTTANCEATDCFEIRQSSDVDSAKHDNSGDVTTGNPARRSAYFGDRRVLLSGSAQFHLEAFSSGFSRTYSFAHSFRAEPSRTRHHLAEFWMIEAELCFVDSLDGLLGEIESFFRVVTQVVLSDPDLLADVRTIEERTKAGSKSSSRRKSTEQRLCDTLSKRFERITYADALKLLAANNSRFNVKVDTDNPTYDIQKEHEKFLVRHFNEAPVFLTDFPAKLKPFYMRTNETVHNGVQTVACADLLVADVGELVGGSVRENNLAALERHVLAQRELVDWYLQLRKAGLPPHAGFGVGFERLLQFLLQIPNIRDVVPFYRFYSSCEL